MGLLGSDQRQPSSTTAFSSFSGDRSIGGGGGRTKNANNAQGSRPWSGRACSSPSVEDAMCFVRAVREAFRGRHPDRYRLFLRLMDDFRSQRIGVADVAASAGALFRDAPDLALGFNAFLPMAHRIHVVGLDDLAAYLVREVNLDDDDDGDGDGDRELLAPSVH